jgi:hypothetical protein
LDLFRFEDRESPYPLFNVIAPGVALGGVALAARQFLTPEGVLAHGWGGTNPGVPRPPQIDLDPTPTDDRRGLTDAQMADILDPGKNFEKSETSTAPATTPPPAQPTALGQVQPAEQALRDRVQDNFLDQVDALLGGEPKRPTRRVEPPQPKDPDGGGGGGGGGGGSPASEAPAAGPAVIRGADAGGFGAQGQGDTARGTAHPPTPEAHAPAGAGSTAPASSPRSPTANDRPRRWPTRAGPTSQTGKKRCGTWKGLKATWRSTSYAGRWTRWGRCRFTTARGRSAAPGSDGLSTWGLTPGNRHRILDHPRQRKLDHPTKILAAGGNGKPASGKEEGCVRWTTSRPSGRLTATA